MPNARAWRLALLAALAALPRPAGANQLQKNEYQMQREQVQKLEPAPILTPQRTGGGGVVTLRIRFYADSEYRASGLRWQERAKQQLAELNRVVEPGFGVRFEAESFHRWERQGGSGQLEPLLAELTRIDPGADVDWVVGLVAPLPLVTTSLHNLGMAQVLGRHFLLRGMSSIEELDSISQAFNLLDPADREALYSRRKQHKELSLFLHEWAHTLGAMHVEDHTRLMCPTYSTRMSQFSLADAGVIGAGLEARLMSRGRDAIDWSRLRGFLAENDDAGWMRDDRKTVLALLGGAQAGAGGGAGWSTEEGATYDRAVALLKQGKEEAAWTALGPLAAQTPRKRQVVRLMCRLSHLAAAGEQGRAACQQAISAAPDDPEAHLDLAQALLLRGQPAEALAAARAATTLIERRAQKNDDAWVGVAAIHRQLGTLSQAEEALRRAGPARGAELETAALARTRRYLGMPTGHPRFHPGVDDELAYAEAFRRASDLGADKKLGEAKAVIDAALRRFPDGPGLHVLGCEIALRQGRAAAAAKACAAALALMDEQPRAHYLTANVKLAQGQPDAAVKSLRRAIALDGKEPVYWSTLAEVLRSLGRRKELSALLAEQAEAAVPPPGSKSTSTAGAPPTSTSDSGAKR
jgi:tetratricopeptide (TPR) repeat protein